jgi:nucleoside-diphosphate-sugar epimerase
MMDRSTGQALVLLGGGYTAQALARLHDGPVQALVRSEAAAAPLRALGAEVVLAPRLERDAVLRAVDGAWAALTFPPDGETDARVAPALDRAQKAIYVSSTGVFGGRTGDVTEATPVDPDAPRARPRLDAEAQHQAHGAIVLRAAGIYGPGRGLHLRLAQGFRMPGDGHQRICRIHVEDLARAGLAALERGEKAALFLAADDAPTPMREVVAWLCAQLGRPLPPEAPLEAVDASLRGDRAIQNGALKQALGLALRFPSYREGFEDCLRQDGIAR